MIQVKKGGEVKAILTDEELTYFSGQYQILKKYKTFQKSYKSFEEFIESRLREQKKDYLKERGA